MNEYYETLLEQLQETVIQLIENSDNIFTARNNIEGIVRDMFSSYIDDNYINRLTELLDLLEQDKSLLETDMVMLPLALILHIALISFSLSSSLSNNNTF